MMCNSHKYKCRNANIRLKIKDDICCNIGHLEEFLHRFNCAMYQSFPFSEGFASLTLDEVLTAKDVCVIFTSTRLNLLQIMMQFALREANDSTCGAHQPGPKLGDRLRRVGYYWPKMISDAITYARRCHACQIHGDFIHQAPGHFHPTSSSWPFEMWEWTSSDSLAHQHSKDIGLS